MGYIKYVYFDDYKIVSGSADGTIRVRHTMLGLPMVFVGSPDCSHQPFPCAFASKVWDNRGAVDTALYTIVAHSRDIINMVRLP